MEGGAPDAGIGRGAGVGGRREEKRPRRVGDEALAVGQADRVAADVAVEV